MKGQIERVESQYQMPLKQILIDLFDQYGTQSAVATELSVSQSTVHLWLLRLGLSQKTILVEKGADEI